ncbi:MAG: hypothetical protein ACKO3M_04345 [Rubrivivax sp.]
MSWIERERKRRQKLAGVHPTHDFTVPIDGANALRALWQRIEFANAALPDDLKLRRERATTLPDNGPRILVWLHAPNGASLGYSGDSVRYVWPERNPRRSYNFWIRWNATRGWLEVSQRISSGTPPVMKDRRFDKRRIGFIVRCMVQGERIKAAQLRKKRFWLF